MVWTWLTEPDRLKSWISWLAEVRQIDPRPLAPVMEDQYNNGQRMQIHNRVAKVVPNQHLHVTLDSADGMFGGEAS